MSLKDISNVTSLNKATLHEHLIKLNEAGLVKKNERDGHKWVYYKLTWKGECLLHPENTRIVVLFCATFMTLFVGIIQLISYVKGLVIGKVVNIGSTSLLYKAEGGFMGSAAGSPIPTDEIFNNKVASGNTTVVPTQVDMVQIASENIGIKGRFHNSPMPSEITETVTDSTTKILIWHDPSLQIIAVVCFIICMVLLSVGIWWFWKNKKSKL